MDRFQGCYQHRGGWDRGQSFDAMFQSLRFAREMNVAAPAKPEDIIRSMLTQPLDFNPGERFAYSNFGYCLLGRVIEKTTGQTYEHFVQTSVLTRMTERFRRSRFACSTVCVR